MIILEQMKKERDYDKSKDESNTGSVTIGRRCGTIITLEKCYKSEKANLHIYSNKKN